jgi:hypothetical protein
MIWRFGEKRQGGMSTPDKSNGEVYLWGYSPFFSGFFLVLQNSGATLEPPLAKGGKEKGEAKHGKSYKMFKPFFSTLVSVPKNFNCLT